MLEVKCCRHVAYAVNLTKVMSHYLCQSPCTPDCGSNQLTEKLRVIYVLTATQSFRVALVTSLKRQLQVFLAFCRADRDCRALARLELAGLSEALKLPNSKVLFAFRFSLLLTHKRGKSDRGPSQYVPACITCGTTLFGRFQAARGFGVVPVAKS